jgi:hypothetical protein
VMHDRWKRLLTSRRFSAAIIPDSEKSFFLDRLLLYHKVSDWSKAGKRCSKKSWALRNRALAETERQKLRKCGIPVNSLFKAKSSS